MTSVNYVLSRLCLQRKYAKTVLPCKKAVLLYMIAPMKICADNCTFLSSEYFQKVIFFNSPNSMITFAGKL